MKVEMCTKNFTIDLSVKRLAEMMPESPDHPVVVGSGRTFKTWTVGGYFRCSTISVKNVKQGPRSSQHQQENINKWNMQAKGGCAFPN